MKIIVPVREPYIITQTYDQHVEYAKANGLCYMPSPCPQKRWYYGGIDYAIPIGTSVSAAADGTVIETGYSEKGYGNYVKISHGGGYKTIYAHLNVVYATEQQKVSTGDTIGLSGSTGFSTGPHLHFELRIDGIPTDPQPYFNGVGPIDNDTPPDNGELEKWEMPTLPVTVSIDAEAGLLLRKNPYQGDNRQGILYNNAVVVVNEIKSENGNYWGKIASNLWIAVYYNGEYLARWK